MPTNKTDYSCHIKAVELVQPIIWVHIMPLVINSLGGGDTHANTHTHTDDPHRINFKKPGAHWPLAGTRLIKN